MGRGADKPTIYRFKKKLKKLNKHPPKHPFATPLVADLKAIRPRLLEQQELLDLLLILSTRLFSYSVTANF